MISTRAFLKSLLVASIAPAILIPKAKDHTRWKKQRGMFVPNPEWETAEYEVKEFYGEWQWNQPGKTQFFTRPIGVRYKISEGGLIAVYSHILA